MKPTFEKKSVPTWALCYLINGDKTGLEDDEIRMVNDWMDRAGVAWVCPPEEEDGGESFEIFPEFGEATMVVPCYCAMKEPNE